MILATIISAFLALQLVFPLAGEDSVRVRASVDTTRMKAVADSTLRAAVPDSIRTRAAADTTWQLAPIDSLEYPAKDTYRIANDEAQEPAAEERIRIPFMGISTNIPYDITWIPGYGITSIPSFTAEFYPRRSKHFTFGADVEWPMWKHWDTHRFMQINNITLWTRRYFPKREDQQQRFKGLYLLANANVARYGIGFDDTQGWQGEGLGASLGIGYKCGLGKGRFFFDTGIAVGYFYTRYDPYVYGNDATGWYYYDYYGNPTEFTPRRMALHWFGPTRVYISIGLDLNRRVKNDRKK